MKYKKVEITWLDATGPWCDETWTQYDEKKHVPAVIKTIGYLIKRCERWIVTASDVDLDEKKFCGIGVIPTGMIDKIVILKDQHG